MNIKDSIRNWLGISEPKPFSVDDEFRAMLRKEIADAMIYVMDGENSIFIVWRKYFPDEGRRFDYAIQRNLGEYARLVASKEVRDRIETEAFIDEVIARIKKKQLQ